MPALCIVDEMETRVLTDEKLAEIEREREQEKKERLEEKRVFEERMQKMEKVIENIEKDKNLP